MLLMVEKGILSGIMQAVKRYAKANNKYMNGLYNPDKMTIFLEYVDINNEQGWPMINKLPTHGFLWKMRKDFTTKKIDELVKKDKR